MKASAGRTYNATLLLRVRPSTPPRPRDPVRHKADPLLELSQSGRRAEECVVSGPCRTTLGLLPLHEFRIVPVTSTHIPDSSASAWPENALHARDLASNPDANVGNEDTLCVRDIKSVAGTPEVPPHPRLVEVVRMHGLALTRLGRAIDPQDLLEIVPPGRRHRTSCRRGWHGRTPFGDVPAEGS